MRSPTAAVLLTGLVVSVAACGGSSAPPTATNVPPATSGPETRWLRGLWAKDISTELEKVQVICQGPRVENRTNVWTCEAATPLVSYKVVFYGSAPAKIEYINAVVTQSGGAKDMIPLRVFGALANLHFEGADPVKARTWIQASLATGGTTEFGPAKYKLAGDQNRRTLDIKAKGSDW
jgi:hypothetical protein